MGVCSSGGEILTTVVGVLHLLQITCQRADRNMMEDILDIGTGVVIMVVEEILIRVVVMVGNPGTDNHRSEEMEGLLGRRDQECANTMRVEIVGGEQIVSIVITNET